MSFKFYLKKRDAGGFSVKLRSYALEDRIKAGRADFPTVEKTLPDDEWARYGFNKKMSYDEAMDKVRVHNSRTKKDDIDEKKARFTLVKREERTDLIASAFLPESIVTEFEKKLKNDSYSVDYEESKTAYHWRTTMRVIAELELDPSDWCDNKRSILNKFKGYAPSTVAKLISLMNQYGVFYCKKINKYFEKITMPKGVEVGRISDDYLDKTGGKTKEAKEALLVNIEFIKNHDGFTKGEKNWCIVACGFALRPSEVDLISDRNSDVLIISKMKVKIYQPKLVSLPRNMRFKEIKIKHEFQKEAFDIIKSKKELAKPSVKKIKRILGEEYGLYSFRKGYMDIMISYNENIETIASDMGHTSIERTWRSYKRKIRKD